MAEGTTKQEKGPESLSPKERRRLAREERRNSVNEVVSSDKERIFDKAEADAWREEIGRSLKYERGGEK